MRVDDLPFRKRVGFSDEREYRVIFESTEEVPNAHFLPIDLDCISKVTLSPFLDSSRSEAVRASLKSMVGTGKVTVGQSRLMGNREWMNLADAAI